MEKINYTKLVWVNKQTKLNATNLNHIEEGIEYNNLLALENSAYIDELYSALIEQLNLVFDASQNVLTLSIGSATGDYATERFNKTVNVTIDTHTSEITTLLSDVERLEKKANVYRIPNSLNIDSYINDNLELVELNYEDSLSWKEEKICIQYDLLNEIERNAFANQDESDIFNFNIMSGYADGYDYYNDPDTDYIILYLNNGNAYHYAAITMTNLAKLLKQGDIIFSNSYNAFIVYDITDYYYNNGESRDFYFYLQPLSHTLASTRSVQMVQTIVYNATTNINGKALTKYQATYHDINDGWLYACYVITRQNHICSKEDAANYMKYMTGSSFVPTYDYDCPQNSILVFADSSMWKPQWDSENGLILFRLSRGYVDITNAQSVGGKKTFTDGIALGVEPTNNSDAATKKYVDDHIAAHKRNSYREVDTTTYSTLNAFLGSIGEEGYMYLYPVDTSDTSKGWKQYVYENNAWVYMGDTNLDLSTAGSLSGNNTWSGNNNFTGDLKKNNKDVATTDQAINVINASDISVNGSTYTFTEDQLAIISNGKPTLIIGAAFGFKGNVLLFPANDPQYTSYDGLAYGQTGTYSSFNLRAYSIHKTTRIMTIYGESDFGLAFVRSAGGKTFFNNKKVPDYPNNPTTDQVLTYGTNNQLSWQDNNGFNVINASDIESNTLTQAQYDLITNGKPTLISGTFVGLTDLFLFAPHPTFSDYYGGICIARNATSNEQVMVMYEFRESTKVFQTNNIASQYILKVTGSNKVQVAGANGTELPNLTSINSQSVNYYLNNTNHYASPTVSSNSVALDYTEVSNLSLSSDTTITLTALTGDYYPEYKANITNSGANAISLTFTGVSKIVTNDSDNVIINSNIITLAAGVSIECSIVNGKMVAYNWDI